MDEKTIKSCICTITALRRLAFNVRGVMDVVDAQNCDTIIKLLEEQRNKRQKGEWLPEHHGECNYVCDVCGNPVNYRANYCDCCGADMRESNITEALVKEFYPNT